MPLRIEDYALIGDTQTAALVGIDGSIDWMCVPRFDSPACFAALLGDESNGRWLLAPAGDVRHVERRYRDDTLVLETDFHTDGGVLQVVDSMPIRDEAPDVVRVARCLEGRVQVRMELVLRFDYGHVVPVGAARPRRRPDRRRRARRGAPDRGPADARAGPHDRRRVRARRRRRGAVRAHLVPVARARAARRRRAVGDRGHDGLVARVVRAVTRGRAATAPSCSAA